MAFNNNNNTTGTGMGNTHDNDGRLGAGTKAARALQPDITKDQSQIHREKAEGKMDDALSHAPGEGHKTDNFNSNAGNPGMGNSAHTLGGNHSNTGGGLTGNNHGSNTGGILGGSNTHSHTGTGLTGNHGSNTGVLGGNNTHSGTGLTGNHGSNTGGLTGNNHGSTGGGILGGNNTHSNTGGLTGTHGTHGSHTGDGLSGNNHGSNTGGLTGGNHGSNIHGSGNTALDSHKPTGQQTYGDQARVGADQARSHIQPNSTKSTGTEAHDAVTAGNDSKSGSTLHNLKEKALNAVRPEEKKNHNV